MKNRNKNRIGYKKTKMGWMPEDWETVTIGDLCTFSSGRGFKKNEWSPAGLPIIRIQNLNGSNRFNYFSGMPENHYTVFPGDLLYSWAGVKGTSFGPQIWNGPKGVLNQHIYKIQTTKHVDSYWLYSSLVQITNEIERKAHGFKSSLLHIHKGEIIKQEIPHPPISEQKKISKILSTWDDSITQIRKLIKAKKYLKKAFIQKLLRGTLRLPGFESAEDEDGKIIKAWKFLRAKELFQNRSIKRCGHEPVLSATQKNGLVLRESLERKIENSSENLSSYKLVEPGDYVISLRSFQGGIECSDLRGIVSPAYHVIRPVKEIDKTFFKYFFKSRDFISHLKIAVIGIRDGKQVSYKDFSFMHLPYPPIVEQKAIGKLLLAVDREVAVLEKKLNQIETQKRGLMQKLLTGEVRVKP